MRYLAKITAPFLVLFILFAFLVGISMIGGGFKLMGKEYATDLIRDMAPNPLIGLFVGVLATSVVQSSSTVTSVLVGMVGSRTLPLDLAIPIVLGANIGTSVTNTIVALGHVKRTAEFRRAFAAGTVHDFFNIFSVALLLPLQIATNFLGHTAHGVAGVVDRLAPGMEKNEGWLKQATGACVKTVKGWLTDASVSVGAGALLSVLGLILMLVSLRYLVMLLKSLFMTRLEGLFDRSLFRNTATSFASGVVVTVGVQSSSVSTSVIVPLAGAGILKLHQIFPFIVGANIGTTVTALIASLAAEDRLLGLELALCHLTFNVCGALIFVPLRRIPVTAARRYALWVSRRKALAVVGTLLIFFGIPLLGILIGQWLT